MKNAGKGSILAVFVAFFSTGTEAAQPASGTSARPALARPLLPRPAATKPIRAWSSQVGLGLSSLSYSDLLSDYKSISTTLTASTTYWLAPGKWVLGGSGYLTMLPITRSGSGKSASMRFLGLNGRIGYVIPGVPRPWMVSLMGGYYFATTFVSTNEFGYSGLSGPQLYPTVRYLMRNGDQISGYLKFSPIASGLSLLSFSNREVAAGSSYTWARLGLALNLDVSDLSLSYTAADGSLLKAKSQTFSLGVSKLF